MDTPTFPERVAQLVEADKVHPAAAQVMRFFAHDHLPQPLKEISGLCAELAVDVVDLGLAGPEFTVGLRKLLEAKDCFVRAALPEAGYPLIDRDGRPAGEDLVDGFRPGVD